MSASISPEQFDYLANLVKQRSGLALSRDKLYLVESRLQPLARAHGCADLPSLVQLVRTQSPERVVVDIVEAMTTNESSFFRDTKPFEQLRKRVLPRVLTSPGAQSGKHLRIWSAACSTGQEPYTIAISLLEESAQLAGWKSSILATDIAQHVLRRAEVGTYTQFEVQRGMPIQLLLKYFEQQPQSQWKVKDAVRALVRFRTLNLLESYAALGNFEIIFCRNVLIYFDEATKSSVLDRLAQSLTPDGVLFLGSTENILGLTTALKPLEGEHGLFVRA